MGKATQIVYKHIQSWRDVTRNGWHVLFIDYHDMCANIEHTIRIIAEFIDVDATDDVIVTVKKKCARKHMCGDSRFNDTLISDAVG